MFENVTPRGVDKIMALNAEFRADPRPEKVNLVIGVYMDAAGNVPVMRAVKAAEAKLLEAETTKTYVSMQGDPDYTALVPRLLLGEDAPALADGRVKTAQTPGGSGALRVGCDLLQAARPGARIWLSTPSWGNHAPIARAAGLEVAQYPYFRAADRGLDFTGMLAKLDAEAQRDDILLLHACCHNPTGVDLAPEQWAATRDLVLARGLFPFVDCAYQGLGTGMEADAAGMRLMAEAAPEMLIASSFSKNFGIYRERTGALTLITETPEKTGQVFGTAEAVIRSNYSMPPSHGARIVASVFADPELEAAWRAELDEMRDRIAGTRTALRDALEARQVTQDLSFLTAQKGMFSYTGFSAEMIARLRDEFAIYAMTDGRINVAAISPAALDRVADGFATVMR